MSNSHPMKDFHPVVRAWFERTYAEPSPPQILGWPSISAGNNTLILAPTGSGKTLAAFLWAINHLVEQHLREVLPTGVRILYVSPLKALNNDIERNLDSPLRGIREEARRAGLRLPDIQTAVRTGDTPQARRASMVRTPPDILITTPESLYLMLTSKLARGMFRTVQYVIVDEIHSVCGNKRGVHLSLSLERLQEVALQEFLRIGLSATQKPLESIAAFLGGQQREGSTMVPRPMRIIDAGRKKEMDLRVECAAPDFSLLPQESIWPLIFAELLALIRLHTTTLLFVNNRRLAERVAAKLNEDITEGRATRSGADAGADRPTGSPLVNLYAVPHETAWREDDVPLVQAYHGSMSRESREQMEADLKAGRLRALVATSSLELGIDIGSIDLVLQLQSPKGIARGLQRVGRSGHLMSATSKGRIFPSHREDLVESAVVARAMQEHDVERTEIPENCLDVLAQQIVAMVSIEERNVERLFDLVRQSYCYRTLSRTLFDGVLQMLAGRYIDPAFRELKARISWDRVNGVLRALPGSGRLAVTSGGTIADRGYFGVYLRDKKTKVGEVDEEFVYETRAGDTFLLGTSVWRVEEIDANRLTVSSAPGQPARMPFWRGEGIGRSYELGVKVGEFRRTMAKQIDDPDCLARLKREYPLDSRAAWNVQEYIRRQRDATGHVPDDRLLLVEGFRDEIGDPRIVVHSSFGRRVNGLLGLVLRRRLLEKTGIEPQMLYNDDGILLRCSDAESLPLTLLDGLTVAEAQSIALEDVLSSPLFGGQFRQNAARALLMPKTSPGKRTPLWLQRLRAGDLLQIARRYDDFPIVVETVRDVLHDVLDFRHFLALVRGIEEGTVHVASVQTETPSPFATSVLFDFIAVYMYEWDQPRADAISQYLSINREILGEVVELDSLPSLLRPEAIAQVEARLQHTTDGTRARSPEELMEILVRVGDLSDDEVVARCEGDALKMIHELAADGRAVQVEFPGGPRWIAGEERQVYDTIESENSVRTVVARYLRSRGPVTTGEIAARYGTPADTLERIAHGLESEREIVRGRFRNPSGEQNRPVEWCYRPALEQMHRRTIAILRHEITPATQAEFCQFLFEWQGLTGPGADISSVLARLQAFPLPGEIWERDVLRQRVGGFFTEQLSQFTAAGNGVWVGSPTGKIRFVFRGNGGVFLTDSRPAPDRLHEPARRILAYLEKNGASFFSDMREGTHLSLAGMNKGIAQLFWDGVITNDVFTEVTAVRRPTRSEGEEPLDRIELVNPYRAPARGRIMQSVRRALRHVPGWTGRWFLVHTPGVMGAEAHPDDIAAAQAEQLLERYGIVAREFHRREDFLPWPILAAQLQRMELRGEIRRGYFVEGLSGMQYALPAAVDALRLIRGSASPAQRGVLLVNACDPANPYGSGIDIPAAGPGTAPVRFSRMAGTYIAFLSGVPVLIVEAYGSRLRTVGSPDHGILRDALESFVGLLRLPSSLRPFKEIVVEYFDDLRPADSPLAAALHSLGFIRDKNQTMRRDPYA